jgi:hypothetical protein
VTKLTRRKATVETAIEETVVEEAIVEAPAPKSLKEQVQQLIAEAPNLNAVQNNPWLYTEWLARLNTLILQ